MGFNPIYKAFTIKPTRQFSRSRVQRFLAMLRDNFSIHTWLLLGAFIQGVLCLLPYHNISLVGPAFLALAFSMARTLLQAAGILHNPYMDGVVNGRTAVVFPNKTGNYENAGDKQLCAIMLAARSNHPFGMFADGFKEVGDYFESMCSELDKNASACGFLGSSRYTTASGRSGNLETRSMLYFNSPEDLHAYAHGPLHTAAMEWWHKTEKKHKHIGLMHELYAVPRKGWEAVYVNYHPSGLGATTLEAKIGEDKVWLNPLVQVKGSLRYSKGRMGRPFGEKEWPSFENMMARE